MQWSLDYASNRAPHHLLPVLSDVRLFDVAVPLPRPIDSWQSDHLYFSFFSPSPMTHCRPLLRVAPVLSSQASTGLPSSSCRQAILPNFWGTFWRYGSQCVRGSWSSVFTDCIPSLTTNNSQSVLTLSHTVSLLHSQDPSYYCYISAWCAEASNSSFVRCHFLF